MNNFIKNTFAKYLRKECSKEEAKEMLHWMKDKKNDPELEKIMQEQWENVMSENLSEVEFADKWQDLEHDLKNLADDSTAISSKKQFGISFIVKVAAGFIIVLSSVLIIFSNRSKVTTDVQAVSHNTFQVDEQNLQKSANRGEKNTYVLTDGTKITLNSGSYIEVDPHYGDETRTIKLVGEAFFEVVPNKDVPFQVYCGKVLTTALGTSFNIRYHEQSKDVAVSLSTGKVSVKLEDKKDEVASEEILNPGEAAILVNSENLIKKEEVDIKKVTAWKDGIMILENANVHEVKETLENWYAVDISYLNLPDKDWTFSGEFRNESLTNVLQGLQYAKGIKYQFVDRNKVSIEFN